MNNFWDSDTDDEEGERRHQLFEPQQPLPNGIESRTQGLTNSIYPHQLPFESLPQQSGLPSTQPSPQPQYTNTVYEQLTTDDAPWTLPHSLYIKAPNDPIHQYVNGVVEDEEQRILQNLQKNYPSMGDKAIFSTNFFSHSQHAWIQGEDWTPIAVAAGFVFVDDFGCYYYAYVCGYGCCDDFFCSYFAVHIKF